MSMDVTELENGSVLVKVRSKRGTGTRDQDEVTVETTFEDLDEAERKSARVNELVAERMADAREVGNSEEAETVGVPSGTENDSGPDVSKVYLGEGSRISGWVPLPKEVVFQEIAPRVRKSEVDDEHVPGVQVNFSEDVPTSGWTEVDAEVVSEEIEPLVRRHRVDEN
ncbi:hypothetical protein [Halorussus sp. MSC15.2]|uniref:DUF7389 domain-containing protein n=1 Tax=Halorussus sp. MSC15.2 TaxID=2283638 RepID=UPI0013D355A1|nr:hypothetical protein [Halorussus sp. MSC15.2]NEU56212.1 hypothetical protein [Halorussus sp. MSC15.2]